MAPVRFSLSIGAANRREMCKAYHKVGKHGGISKCNGHVRIEELNARAEFARKFYKNKYDKGHKKWMQALGKQINYRDKLALSLDALAAIRSQP